jgi:cohesin complex subunit SA-1/2
MFRSQKAKQSKIAKTPKKPQSRGRSDINDDWEALCRDIDGKTAKVLLQILTAAENSLAKLSNKKLEEPDVDDDPVDPDDEPESDDDDADDEQARDDKHLRSLIAERSLCALGARLVHAVHAGSFDGQGQSVVRKRLEHNKVRLTPTWREIVNHLDAVKQTRKGTKTGAKPMKEIAKSSKSKEIVVDDESDENEEEDPGDEIEDEDMADEERLNDAAESRENGDVDAEEGSIIGD